MEQTYNHTYLSAAGDNQIISSGPAILHKIIVGADTGSAVIEVSNSPTDGDVNLVAKFTGSTLMTALAGGIVLDLVCRAGITLDLTNQADVTVLWRPTIN